MIETSHNVINPESIRQTDCTSQPVFAYSYFFPLPFNSLDSTLSTIFINLHPISTIIPAGKIKNGI